MPENPRIPVPATPNPVYLTNAFLQAPGGQFWESPGKVRRSGAIQPQLLYCAVTANKANHGTHPAFLGYRAEAIIAAWVDEPLRSYYGSITPTARFADHHITGSLNGRARHSLTGASATGAATSDIFWELDEWDPGVWTQDRTWMRRRSDFSADAFTTVTRDDALGYQFVRDDGITVLQETGVLGNEIEPLGAYQAVRPYVLNYGGTVLGQFTANNGRQYLTLAKDYFPAHGFRNTQTDGSGHTYRAGYTEHDFSAYDGSFDSTAPIGNDTFIGGVYSTASATAPVNSTVVAGWQYDGAVNETAISATRATIKLPAAALDPRRILFLLVERTFGSAADNVTALSSIMLAPGQIYDYVGNGGAIPSFSKFQMYRWVMATFG